MSQVTHIRSRSLAESFHDYLKVSTSARSVSINGLLIDLLPFIRRIGGAATLNVRFLLFLLKARQQNALELNDYTISQLLVCVQVLAAEIHDEPAEAIRIPIIVEKCTHFLLQEQVSRTNP